MVDVQAIMTQPTVIRSSATVEDALSLMQDHQVRVLVVAKCHEDGCYSILTAQDIVYRVAAQGIDPAHVRVGTLMGQACVQLVRQMSLQAAAQCLAEAQVSHAPVIEDNKLIGLVSVTDILRQLYPVSGNKPEPAPNTWRSPQSRYAYAGRTGKSASPEMRLSLEDDMRFGCTTRF